MSDIAAVILTYNRRDLLRKCLEAVFAQTCAPNSIVVIDNGSSDGTAEYLTSITDVRLIAVRLPSNIGAAGGFSRAFQTGCDTGAGHIWVMDDDVVPEPDALERLLDASEKLERAGEPWPFLLSIAYTPGGAITNVPDIDRSHVVDGYPQWARHLEEGIMPVRRATFVSALFDTSYVRAYRLPIADMYMWAEDSEYTLRLTRENPGYQVATSRVTHLRAQPGVLDIRTDLDPGRIRMHRIHTRNLIYTARKYHSRWVYMHTVLRTVRATLKLMMQGQVAKGWLLARGLFQGLVFNPAIPPCDQSAISKGSQTSPAVANENDHRVVLSASVGS